MNIVRQICRKIYRDNINILTCPTHESFETGLCKTGYNFYSALHPQVKTWNSKFRPVPENYSIITDIPPYLDFDLVLSQNKFGQYQILTPIAKQFQLPIISLEHTLPMPNWGNGVINQIKMMRGDINLFISDYSVEKWGFSHNDPSIRVIKHGVDTETFKPDENKIRENRILGINNDWINRDWCCGWTQFNDVTKELPRTIVGDTKGLSEPAKDLNELVNFYQTHRIYLNTAHISPIPSALLEAMACGCAVVSCNTAAIPDYITHGVNGFLANNIDEMKSYVNQLMNDDDLAKELGKNAINTINEKFSIDIFVNNWKKLIEELV